MQISRPIYIQTIAVIIISTLTFCLSTYHRPFQTTAWNKVLFYLAVPLITILALRQNPLNWGLGLGDWRWTLGSTLAGAVGVVLVLLLFSASPAMRNYYRPARPLPGEFWGWLGLIAVELFAWEFIWRGFMLFGLMPALGEWAIYVQMIPFTIAHVGKPEMETLTSIAGGILLGYVVRQCRSFWPAFLLHLFLYAGVHFI